MITERHLIVVAPHPDDETLALGGTIHDHLRAGGTCEIVAVTDGESADDLATPDLRRRMAERRQSERAAAMVALGAGEVEITELHLPDRHVPAHTEALTEALSNLLAQRRRHLRSYLVAAPWRNDPHLDHRASGAAAAEAARLTGSAFVETPIWGWYRPDWRRRLPHGRTRRLPISEEAMTAKRAALQCFISQLEPLPGGRGAVLPPDFLEAFSGTDEMILA
jgi:LmbE family N-acetylglucosaminyl deacetylase